MQETKIKWADDTANPVMGSDRCEQWPKLAAIASKQIAPIVLKTNQPRRHVSLMVKTVAERSRKSAPKLVAITIIHV